jgi:hypothetical protein
MLPFPDSVLAVQDTSNAAIMKAITELKANQMTLHRLLNTVKANQGTIVTLIVSLMEATVAVNGSGPGGNTSKQQLMEALQKSMDSYANLMAATSIY